MLLRTDLASHGVNGVNGVSGVEFCAASVADARVAGRAHLLVTSNFRDFLAYRKDVREKDRIAIYQAAHHRVVIAHLYTTAAWLREGRISIPPAA